MSDILLVFIKNPRPGRVKTRLARTVGDAEALRIYRLLLDKTRDASLAAKAERWLFYSDEIAHSDNWPEADFVKKLQHGGDLGERMSAAFREAFAAGATRVVIIGSDCPELDGPALDTAFARLHEADFVLGPTPDGGYYLLGMKQLEPAVFRDVAWSTAEVMAQTVAIVQDLGCSFVTLPVLSDIDTEEDWRAYLRRAG